MLLSIIGVAVGVVVGFCLGHVYSTETYIEEHNQLKARQEAVAALERMHNARHVGDMAGLSDQAEGRGGA